MNSSLVIFARIPEIGIVKTRLQTRYTEAESLALYRAMLWDVLDLAVGLKNEFRRLSVYWAGDSPIPPPDIPVPLQGLFEHYRQTGSDLGMRMFQATAEELERGSKKVIIIGCDSPDLPPEHIVGALRLLDSAPLVFGPSEDGGYYLVGSSRLCKEAFQEMDWGSSGLLEQTKQKLGEGPIEFLLLPPWYDIDRPEDLDRLAASEDGERAQNLKACLAGIEAVRGGHG